MAQKTGENIDARAENRKRQWKNGKERTEISTRQRKKKRQNDRRKKKGKIKIATVYK